MQSVDFAANPSATVDEISDHDLMLAVRDGDTDCLGDLFERHHGRLYGFYVRLCGDRSAAEDMVQQVFHRVLKYRHTYRDDGAFTAWMYHMARRVMADHYRKSARAGVPTDPEDFQSVADHGPAADEQAAKSDDVALIHRALADLNPDHREVITLHRFQGLPHDEIARILNIKVGAVKVRMHRAVSALREGYLRLRNTSALA